MTRQIDTVMIFLIINFLAISVVITVILYDAQNSAQERDQLITLTKAIDKAEQTNANTTDRLVLTNLAGTDRNYIALVNTTEHLSGLIIKNQELIKSNQELLKNTTENNLKNTFINRDHISQILAEHIRFGVQLQNIEHALNITDQQKIINNTED